MLGIGEEGKMAVTVSLQDYLKQTKALNAIQTKSARAMKYALSNIKRDAPKVIATKVADVYNIKPKEITPAKTRKLAGGTSISVKGDTIATLQITYKGRPLTPIHFEMSKKKPSRLLKKKMLAPAAGLKLQSVKGKGKAAHTAAYVRTRNPYTIELEIFKGEVKRLKGYYDTPPFLAPASKTSSTFIPFQRTEGGRWSVQSIHTVSVPQMVSGENTRGEIEEITAELINKTAEKKLSSFLK